jgi:hypothetical protein
MREHDRGVDVDGNQRPACTQCALAGQCPAPGGGPGFADRPQRPRPLRRQRADQAGDDRVGGHRPAQLRLGAQHRDISQAATAQGQRHGKVGNDLPRVVHRTRRPPPLQGTRRALAQARHTGRFGQQQHTSLGHQPLPVSRHSDLGAARGILHGKSAFGSARTGS